MSMRLGLLTTIKAVLTNADIYQLDPGDKKRISGLKIDRCAKLDELAGDRDTPEKKRMFAHWGCRPNTICLASDFPKLTLSNQLGIILHEIGHACCGSPGEPQADLWIKDRFDIDIEYSDEIQLQRVKPEVVKMFKDAGNGK